MLTPQRPATATHFPPRSTKRQQRPHTAAFSPPRPMVVSGLGYDGVSVVPLRRLSFSFPRKATVKNFPASDVPRCGRFTPRGGFYTDSTLESDFAVSASVLRGGFEKPTTTTAPMRSDSHDSFGDDAMADEAGDDDLPQCEMNVWVPLSDDDLLYSFRAMLRRVRDHIPNEGTKYVVTLRRVLYKGKAVDISLAFQYATWRKDPTFCDTVQSVVRSAIIRDEATRRGKWAVFPSSESLTEYFYTYCTEHLERDNPADMTACLVFVEFTPVRRESMMSAVERLLDVNAAAQRSKPPSRPPSKPPSRAGSVRSNSNGSPLGNFIKGSVGSGRTSEGSGIAALFRDIIRMRRLRRSRLASQESVKQASEPVSTPSSRPHSAKKQCVALQSRVSPTPVSPSDDGRLSQHDLKALSAIAPIEPIDLYCQSKGKS